MNPCRLFSAVSSRRVRSLRHLAALCGGLLCLLSGVQAGPVEKPIFSCRTGGNTIEVFAGIDPFDAARHKFELVKEDGRLEEWRVDGKRLTGDGRVLNNAGFSPTEFKTVLRPIEVRWNGKAGIVTGTDSPCFDPVLETDPRKPKHFRFSPSLDGDSISISFFNEDLPGACRVWLAVRNADVSGKPDPDPAVTGSPGPILDSTIHGEHVILFFSDKPFDRLGHDVLFTRRYQKGDDGVSLSLKIDGKDAFGVDQDLQGISAEIDRFEIHWNGRRVAIPAKLYQDCFNPGSVRFYPAPDGRSVLVEITGGDGGGAYGAGWILRKNGRHSRTNGPPGAAG